MLKIEEQQFKLQQVMAMCLEVEERAVLKLGSPVVVNSVTVPLCRCCQKSGHKIRMCRQKESDRLLE